MNKTEMNDQVFEIMLKFAVEEEFQREMKEFPKEDMPVDDALSSPAKAKIRKMIRKSYFRSIRLRMGKITKKAAVIVAVLLPFYVGSLLSVEASRNAIFNALLDWKSNHANILYQDSALSSARETSSGAVEPQYLPKGFTEYGKTKSGSVIETEYRNEQGVKILLSQGPLSSGGNIGVDTEHTTETEVEIQGEKAFLFTAVSSGENSYLVWNSRDESFLLISKISTQELIKIAESMEI